MRGWWSLCRLYLDNLPIPDHRIVGTPPFPWRLTLPTCKLLRHRTFHCDSPPIARYIHRSRSSGRPHQQAQTCSRPCAQQDVLENSIAHSEAAILVRADELAARHRRTLPLRDVRRDHQARRANTAVHSTHWFRISLVLARRRGSLPHPRSRRNRSCGGVGMAARLQKAGRASLPDRSRDHVASRTAVLLCHQRDAAASVSARPRRIPSHETAEGVGSGCAEREASGRAGICCVRCAASQRAECGWGSE